MKTNFAASLLTGFSIILFLNGCDGSLTVTGQIIRNDPEDDTLCDLSLWRHGSSVWKAQSRGRSATATVHGIFDVDWVIGGPEAEHWIELFCAGYEVFRSPTFHAPSITNELHLGNIELTAWHGSGR